MVLNEIKKSNKISSWKALNLYEDPLSNKPYPQPLLKEYNLIDPFEGAKRHYSHCDFAACLNSLRRYCERKLIEILPSHLSLEIGSTGETKYKMLGALITSFSGAFCQRFGLVNPCPNWSFIKIGY